MCVFVLMYADWSDWFLMVVACSVTSWNSSEFPHWIFSCHQNTELLIVEDPWMYISYTLKTTPGPSSPSTSARCILAHHRPTTSQKNMLRSYKSSLFFRNRMGVLYFTTIMSQLPERLLGIRGLEVSRTTRIILEVSRRFESVRTLKLRKSMDTSRV